MQGVLVKDYRIINAIGEGGMATVYLAEHQLLGHKVAVKILHDELIRNKNIRSRLIAEAKNMARMNHPNIIKVIDLVDDRDLVAFVMEYIEGETLKAHIERRGPLRNEEINIIFLQILEAVKYVHNQNLVHRDIKPSNFIVDTDGKIKLLDFGIAKNLNPNSAEYTITEKHAIMGTVMYMSPEQVKSTKEVTYSTDIYSLGVVLWQMLAGRAPYDANELSVPEIQISIIKEKLPNINPLWDGIIQKATQKISENRYYSITDFQQSLQRNEQQGSSRTKERKDKTSIDNSKNTSNNNKTIIDVIIIDEDFPYKTNQCFVNLFYNFGLNNFSNVEMNIAPDKLEGYDEWCKSELFSADFFSFGFSINGEEYYFHTFKHEWVLLNEKFCLNLFDANSISFYLYSELNRIIVHTKIFNALIGVIIEFGKTDFYKKSNQYFLFQVDFYNKLLSSLKEAQTPVQFLNLQYQKLNPKIKSVIKWNLTFDYPAETPIWQNCVTFEVCGYKFCFGQFEKRQEWSILSGKNVYTFSRLLYSEKVRVDFKSRHKLSAPAFDAILDIVRSFSESKIFAKDLYFKLRKLVQNKFKDEKSFFIGKSIPENKKQSFLNRINSLIKEHNKVAFLVYYDDTVFGSGSCGWAIMATENYEIFLVFAPLLSEEHIYTLNFDHLEHERISSFRKIQSKIDSKLEISIYNNFKKTGVSERIINMVDANSKQGDFFITLAEYCSPPHISDQ